MRYIKIENNRVTQIINEVDPLFPNVPIRDRYASDFLAQCICSNDISIKLGYIYDPKTKTFYEPTAPSPSFTLEEAKNFKMEEISKVCEETIINGFYYGDAHYSLTLSDQTNVATLTLIAKSGKNVSYHADGEACRPYTPEEFLPIANAATYHKMHNLVYHNLLKLQMLEYTTTEEVYAVKYGVTELNDVYKEQYNENMETLV